MKYSNYNVVIIGSGMAGLYLANKLSQNKNFKDGILVVTKEELFSGSTSLAQGGIVSVIPEINPLDSIESHILDTIRAGCDLNDINVVKTVSENSALVAQELISFGVEFDKNDKNNLNFTLEAAHSHPRILHSKGDSTGRVIEETLCKITSENKNIDVYEYTSAVEILSDKSNCAKGIIVYKSRQNTYEAIYADSIVIATGGIGQLFEATTNPLTSSADGIALASVAGAEVENMEFVQFHPTALYCKDKKVMPLVSESVRGEGAKLVDKNGCYFAKNYHCLGDLAPRDVVARAINEQMEITDSEYVNLDISQIGIEKFRLRFPTVTKLCKENGIDVSLGLIPVRPAEHYFMGGIKTDLNAQTSVKNLYAIGECASTGLHGANRLASNSLLECGVFAGILAQKLILNSSAPPRKLDSKIINTIEKYKNLNFENDKELEYIEVLFKELKSTMTKKVGIVRNNKKLTEAFDEVYEIKVQLDEKNLAPSKEKFELNNALYVSSLIINAALKRKKSIGAHFRDDDVSNVSKTTKIEFKENILNDKLNVK